MDDWIEDEALRADRRRVWRHARRFVVIGLLLGAVGGLALAVGTGDHDQFAWVVIGGALTIGGFAGIAAVWTTSMGQVSYMNEARRTIPSAFRRASVKAVYAGDADAVPSEHLPEVRAWAEWFLLATPFSSSQGMFLLSALVGTRVFSLSDDPWITSFNAIYFVAVGIAVAIAVPMTWRRLRGARAFVLAERGRDVI